MNYSATQMAKKLDISRSYLYYLKDNGIVELEVNEKGRTVWTEAVYHQLKEYIKKNNILEKQEVIELPYKTTKINNRRYLGNKYKLLPFITKVVNEECQNVNTVADIFAGTGAVASAFTDKKIITNDIMYSNYICHLAWFSSEEYSEEKIIELIINYNTMVIEQDNYMSENFANTYFSLDDCRKIGFIRQDIEDRFVAGDINARERALLITSLLYAMDKIANTCGHYDAYRQGAEFEKCLELSVPQPDETLNENNVCYNMDTNELVSDIDADLVYIDPPYNSRQYCDAYHLLENVARWNKPEVFGVAKKMDRTSLKSDYCTQKATVAFEKLIDSIHAKYIMLSYNNMAKKGNDRSNAKISDEDIMRILQKKGTVKVFTEDYKSFSTGKSDIKDNQERLFVCTCYESGKEIIPSALNYTGGKYKLLPQILPFFPKDVDKVVDLFCGGCNVGININCNKVQFNDSNKYLIGLLDTFRRLTKDEIFEWLFTAIDRYNLSLVSENGYEYYGCESSKGLGSYNKEGYNKLRKDFNNKTIHDDEYFLMLYLLIVYSFNNQLRFNKKGEFNLPVGKRDFNAKMQEKLKGFLDRIKSGDYGFINRDFREIKLDEFTDKSFFYVDPPYLITCATYNEQDGWTEKDEYDLLSYLEQLDKKGIRFALSNVLENKGKKNKILSDWIEKNKKFKAISLDYDYSNSNYHTKREGVTKEVLVVNY
ncbi:Dam family site-specific DNA-(adenine-N6)-methyltransferase [uncultured Eubacterium sp.]|uniref:Dam family site-specific DNA-(adenine-N6)-methyltransferase n=1 Tax=uncultured Eubacterium sp. TaxID=165185 RepID=UPI0026736934|nr:Dam family site-specific DNA-(adenine-N6)-methyltransferase [uncultured Eubacterium sp.]